MPINRLRAVLSGVSSIASTQFGACRIALHHDAATAALAVVLAVLVLAAARALRLRGPADYAYLALFAVAVCLAANATAEFTTALRNTAFLIALAPFVLVSARPHSEAAAGPKPAVAAHARPRALS